VNPALRDRLDRVLPAPVAETASVTGGCINDAWRADLGDGTRVFVKSNPDPPPHTFEIEAAGLRWLADGLRDPDVDGVAVPAVVAWRDDAPAFLALEWVESTGAAAPGSRDDAHFGAGLARVHRAGAARFGWDHDGYVGDLAQPNTPHDDWPTFLRDQRLEPLVRAALDGGTLPVRAGPAFARLLERLVDLVGPAEPPSRLHGDLWSGNRLIDASGTSWLLDPAPYGGHREVDLAMMRLFGGFGEPCFAAYTAVWPLPDGHQDRLALYQLYPLLVHVVLFGAAYVGRTMEALDRYA
jgi:fructosamine-3-kinase